jgi:peptidoglycan hydrolase CwlO-like protein
MARTSAPPNKEILEAALQGLEAQRARLDEQIAQVRSLMGRRAGRPSRSESAAAETANHTGAASSGGRKKRVLSPEARKRIAAAQKKRWAAFRKRQ